MSEKEKDTVFRQRHEDSDFRFNEQVSRVFNDMLNRSVPFYEEVLRMSAELARQYTIGKTEPVNIYDLGCSTGNMATAIAAEFKDKKFVYNGYDNSEEMLKRAEELTTSIKQPVHFFNKDILDAPLTNAAVIIANYTFQFIRPIERGPLARHIFNNLNPGGVFIFSEKMLETNSDNSRMFNRLYYDMKRRNGYSELEISKKREALENVLIPYRIDENIRLLQEAGFEHVDVFFKWYNFTSLIATRAS